MGAVSFTIPLVAEGVDTFYTRPPRLPHEIPFAARYAQQRSHVVLPGSRRQRRNRGEAR